jgi:dTDP-4-amino-4,6-dideoxy-D-galactose acyltransferase
VIELLAWDSEFFGAQIGRAEVDGDLERVIDETRGAAVDCVYLVMPGIALDAASEAIRRGAVLTDLRLSLECDEPARAKSPKRLATAVDASIVEGLAVRLAAFSRFSRDPRFAADRVDEMYRVWARLCLETGVVALAPEDEGLVGLRVVGGVARVELVYVSPESSGAGVARELIAAALEQAGAPRAEVATQFGNVPALRLYEALGFRVRTASTILHAWLDAWH